MADISKIKPLGSNTTYNIKDNSAIANITRSGTTFTATRRDGTTFTFSQQDNNTDTLVKQTAKTDNANYKILTTTSASPTSGSAAEAGYGANLAYNPSLNRLSTGNLKLTGELDVTGNAYLHNQTTADSLTAGSLLVNGNTNFVQSPTAPTPASGDNSTKLATTEFVKTSVAGLSGAMHFRGTTTTEMTDGRTTAAVTIGGSSYTPSAGDVVLYSDSEFVWTGSAWERLGRDSSFKTTQSAVDTGTAATNKWVSRIQQNANGVVTATMGTLDTSGTWSGNAATASSAEKLTTARTIWGQSFNGLANISGNLTGAGPNLFLPANQSTFQFLTSQGGAATGKYGRLLLSGGYDQGDLTNYRLYVNGGNAYLGGKVTITGTKVSFTGIGEGLEFNTDNSYFGTNYDARTIDIVDNNPGAGSSAVDGGLVFRAIGRNSGTDTIQELLRIRNHNGSSSWQTGEFQWKTKDVVVELGTTAKTWNIAIAGNAATATNVAWSGITGKPSSFTPSSHTHYELATQGDNRDVATTPNDYVNRLVFRGLKRNSAFGSPSTDVYSYVVGLRGWADYSGGNSHELAFNNTGIYWRSGATTSWGNWYRIYTTGNKPTKSDVGLGNVTNDAQIPKSIGTTKGDIIYWSAASTPARLAIGSAGQVLKVSSNGIPTWSSDNNTDTKVNVVARGTTKAYLLADTTAPTSTAAAHTAVAETGVYLDTTAGKLVATSFAGSEATIGRNIICNNTSAPGQGEAVLTALGYKTGYPVYTDPTFLSGTNSVGVYNNSGGGTVTITRDTYSNYGINSPGTNSNYVLKITSAGTASPGIGGFVQTITSRANAQFIQIFRALIPTGRDVVQHSNTMGTLFQDHWLTSTAGTGKWEWYARRVICGQAGTFSTGGYVSLNGAATTASAPFTWYLGYCNVYDLTRADYDGLRVRYADNASTATKLASTGTTGQFWRGDNSWSSTLTGSLTISRAGEDGVEVVNSQTTNPHSGLFGVGSSGNLGIYDRTKGKWVVYSDPSGNVVLNGNASTATALTSSAGSATLPIYFSNGKPVACTASSLFSALSWAAGTTAGPTLSVTVAGQNRTATIPSAAAGASGIVTTASQQFDGNKTFKGHIYPQADITYNLGSSSLRWKNFFLGGTTRRTSRIYPFVTSQERSQWYKITFPYSTATTDAGQAKWFMNSFDLHFGGGYSSNAAGIAHVIFYWTRAKNNGAWAVNQTSAMMNGILMGNIKLYYRIAEPGILYVNNSSNVCNGIWLDNLYVDDTAPSLDWSTTKIETCSAITADTNPALSAYTQIPTARIYNGNNSTITIGNATQISGNLTLYSSSGDSPSLIFNRTASGATDWKIVVTSGKLSFQSGTDGSTWTERAYFRDNSGDFVATSFTGNGSALTNLNASNLASGTVANARLPARLQAYQTSASNDSTECGWYYGTSGSPFTKYHTTAGDFMVWTNGYSGVWASEIGTDFRSNRLAVRNKNNGTWSAWNELASNNSIVNEFTWTSDIYYDAVNNRFTNTRATNSWASQIYSKHGFSTGCYISFRVEDTTHYRMVGLNSDPTTDTGYSSIDYCWYPQSGGGLSIYENGSSISSISGHTTYAAGDDFRIEYSDGYVRYYHNGVLCRSVARAISGQLYADSSLYSGGTIVDLRFGPITAIGADGRYVNVTGDTMTGPLYINSTEGASGTNSSGALIIGTKAGANIAIDDNEIMARNNSAVSTLYLNNAGGLVSIGSGGLSINSLSASQAVSTDANKKLVSTNLTVSDPTASGTGITYIATISQSAVGKITVTKSTVRSASTSQTGVIQITADNANSFLNQLSIGSSTPVDADYYISQYAGGGTTTTTYHRRSMSALWSYINGKIASNRIATATQYGVAYYGSTTKITSTAQGAANTALMGKGAAAPAFVAVSPSSAWTAGTTAGPTLKITVLGVTQSTGAAIPVANGTTASGVVTTTTQTFGGNKTFSGVTTFSNTTDSAHSKDTAAAVVIKGGLSVEKKVSAKEVRIDNNQTSKGVSLQYDQTLEVLNFVFP